MQIASVVASVLTLVAIACERFVGIMYPLKQKLTRRKTLACIAVIWLVSLSVIMIMFVMCWSPLEMMLLYMEYADVFPSWWSHFEWIAYFLAYANTAINPYIYAGMSDNYKKGARRLKDVLLEKYLGHSHRRLMVPIKQPFRHSAQIVTRKYCCD